MESDLETIAERMRAATTNSALDIGTAWNLLAEGADEIERLRHRIAGLIELQGRDSKELRALCQARDEARRDKTALRSMVDQQNAALNDAANEIERLSTALAVTLESLDQIGAMTKQSRASVNARSAVVFVRTQLESTK